MQGQKLLNQSKSAKFREVILLEGYSFTPLLGFESDVFFFMEIPFSAFMGIVGFREMRRGCLMKYLRRMVEVLDLFGEMRVRSGFKSNAVNVVSVLPVCGCSR